MIWLDWVILTIIFINMLHGFYLGTFRTCISAVKYPIAFVLILMFGPQAGEFLLRPWNLTQNIALSLKDMVMLPDQFYQHTIQISRLGEELGRGDSLAAKLYASIQEILLHIEIPQTLRDLITSIFQPGRIAEYLTHSGADFQKYSIENLGELAFYTLGSFIAKLFAISLGAIVIIVVIILISHFVLAMFNQVGDSEVRIGLPSRFVGAAFKGGVCFFVLVLLLEFSTPLLCYFMIDPNHSVVFSAVANSAHHIRPWVERVLLTM